MPRVGAPAQPDRRVARPRARRRATTAGLHSGITGVGTHLHACTAFLYYICQKIDPLAVDRDIATFATTIVAAQDCVDDASCSEQSGIKFDSPVLVDAFDLYNQRTSLAGESPRRPRHRLRRRRRRLLRDAVRSVPCKLRAAPPQACARRARAALAISQRRWSPASSRSRTSKLRLKDTVSRSCRIYVTLQLHVALRVRS